MKIFKQDVRLCDIERMIERAETEERLLDIRDEYLFISPNDEVSPTELQIYERIQKLNEAKAEKAYQKNVNSSAK